MESVCLDLTGTSSTASSPSNSPRIALQPVFAELQSSDYAFQATYVQTKSDIGTKEESLPTDIEGYYSKKLI